MPALSDYVDFDSQLSGQEVADVLNALTIDVEDSQAWHSIGLADVIGDTELGMVDELFKATPGMDWVRLALAGTGLPLNQPRVQQRLQELIDSQLVPAPIKPVLTAIKLLGIHQVSPWTYCGRQGTATAQDVADIRAELAADAARAVVNNWVASVMNDILNPRASDATIAGLKQQIAELA